MDDKTDNNSSEVAAPKTDKTAPPAAAKTGGAGLIFYLTHYAHVWIFLGMLLLAFAGMWLIQTQSENALVFWMALVPVFGALSAYRAWRRSTKRDKSHWPVVWRQVLHWLGLIVVIGILFFLQQREFMTGEAAAITSMLLLALTCFLAGVHFEWTFLVLGAVLIIMSGMVAYLQENAVLIWLIMAIVSIGAIAIVFLRGARDEHGPHEQ